MGSVERPSRTGFLWGGRKARTTTRKWSAARGNLLRDNHTEQIIAPVFLDRSSLYGLSARFFLLMPIFLLSSCTTFDKNSTQAIGKQSLTHGFGYVGCKVRNPDEPDIKTISEVRIPHRVTYMVMHTAYCGLEPNASEAWYESARNTLYLQYRYESPGRAIDPKSATCMCDYWTAFEFDRPMPEIRQIHLFGESISLTE